MGMGFYGAKDTKKPRFTATLQIVVEFYVMSALGFLEKGQLESTVE